MSTTPDTTFLPMGRCANCAYWQPCMTQVPGCEPEKICGISRRGGYGLHGQDGRAIITPAAFGCIEWSPRSDPHPKSNPEEKAAADRIIAFFSGG